MNRIIAIGGAARVGKDTLCNLLTEKIKKDFNIECERFALADRLKLHLYHFIKDNFNIDIYTASTEEKNKVRGLLVEYGKIRRKESEGTYWTSRIKNDIILCHEKNIIPIITDIRYDEYAKDEVYWAKEELNGILVHVKKYISHGKISQYENEDKVYPEYLNNEEKENDPRIEAKAEFKIDWPHVEPHDIHELNPYVDKLIEYLQTKNWF